MITQVWHRGTTIEYVLTVSSNGTADDLSLATSLELQLKAEVDGADPALVSLGIGTGITLRTQSGTTLGMADVVIPYTALASVADGTYWMDVVVTYSGSPNPIRRLVIPPTKVMVRGVVNQP
jgi:hypothetical protein